MKTMHRHLIIWLCLAGIFVVSCQQQETVLPAAPVKQKSEALLNSSARIADDTSHIVPEWQSAVEFVSAPMNRIWVANETEKPMQVRIYYRSRADEPWVWERNWEVPPRATYTYCEDYLRFVKLEIDYHAASGRYRCDPFEMPYPCAFFPGMLV